MHGGSCEMKNFTILICESAEAGGMGVRVNSIALWGYIDGF